MLSSLLKLTKDIVTAPISIAQDVVALGEEDNTSWL